MAIKLFAHVLRGSTGADERNDDVEAASTEGRRSAFRGLVVRRVDLAAWGLAAPPPARCHAGDGRNSGAEPIWPDTQPSYHK